MLAHTMTFDTFREKSFAVHWIKEHIDPDDFDECLTQLKIAFFTGVQPSKNTVDRMLKEVPHASYESHDF